MADESERIGYLAREDGATPTVTLGIRLKWSSPGTRDTYTYRRAFDIGALNTHVPVIMT